MALSTTRQFNHFADDLFEIRHTGRGAAGGFPDVQADFQRAGEGDEVKLRRAPWDSACAALKGSKQKYPTGRGDEALARLRSRAR